MTVLGQFRTVVVVCQHTELGLHEVTRGSTVGRVGYVHAVSGSTYCNGVWATDGISGGTSVTLGTYSGGSQGGGPGGGPGGGRW